MSRYINKHKSEYYRLLQSVRIDGAWEDWILFFLDGIEQTALEAIDFIQKIKLLMLEEKKLIRGKLRRIYSQDLINNIFRHPYTKIEFIMKDLNKKRVTATKYLNKLVEI